MITTITTKYQIQPLESKAHFHSCPRESESQDEWCVIEFIWKDKAAWAEEGRQIEHIGGKTHPEGDGIVHA